MWYSPSDNLCAPNPIPAKTDKSGSFFMILLTILLPATTSAVSVATFAVVEAALAISSKYFALSPAFSTIVPRPPPEIFGLVGLKSTESGTVSAKQIEASRQAIMRKIKRSGKLWIRVYPNTPITKKPIEVRMGKGKGSVSYYSAKVSSGTVLFELCGVNKNTAVAAFKTGGAKLPIKTKVVF